MRKKLIEKKKLKEARRARRAGTARFIRRPRPARPVSSGWPARGMGGLGLGQAVPGRLTCLGYSDVEWTHGRSRPANGPKSSISTKLFGPNPSVFMLYLI
ncbi:hypothetical protein AAC387_Pa07g1528 [Persea americana]